MIVNQSSHNARRIVEKVLTNPGQLTMTKVPNIAKKYNVSILEYWAESAYNPSLVIRGTEQNVNNALDEMIQTELMFNLSGKFENHN